jgi:glycosyltransferase involved in cell wall biosynthesis
MAAFGLAAWVYLIAARGNFWREFVRREPDCTRTKPVTPLPSVLAVIPARDEAAVVGYAVASVADQRYAGYFHILLVDDGSSDGTAEVARAAVPPGLLTVVPARPLPPGWTGKLWAVAEGIRQAPFEPDFLLLTDADIVHSPENLTKLAARMAEGNDLVSFMAMLECGPPPSARSSRHSCSSSFWCSRLHGFAVRVIGLPRPREAVS